MFLVCKIEICFYPKCWYILVSNG